MEQTINANLNSADCIKSVTKIGETVYHNICSGSISSVPWGVGDWIGGIIIFAILLGGAIMVIGMAISVIKGWKSDYLYL